MKNYKVIFLASFIVSFIGSAALVAHNYENRKPLEVEVTLPAGSVYFEGAELAVSEFDRRMAFAAANAVGDPE